MTTNRATRRAKVSKKKSGKTLTRKPLNGKSRGMPEIPQLSASQKRVLKKLKDNVIKTKCRVADLCMEEARTLSKLGQEQVALQEQIKNTMQGAGIDFEHSPPGTWGIDFDTMKISFEPAE